MTDPSRTPAEDLGNRLEFETLLADLSSRFINLPPDEVDRQIEDALRGVCALLGIDVAVLWQWSTSASDVITPTHAFPSREGPGPFDPLRQESYPWVAQQMRAGRVVLLSSLEDLPPEAAVDAESARLSGIRSNLTLPLSVGGEPPIGALAFNTLRVEREWPAVVVKRLQLVAQVFTKALARRRHELSLRESEERLSLAADSAEAGLWTLDLRTGVFWVTDRARALFGYSPAEVIRMERFAASVHPDDWELVRDAVERSARAGEPIHVEYRILLPGDGRVRWIASRGRPQRGPTGVPERLTGISTDVTERRHGEEALRASEARLAAGADLAGLGFYEVDLAEGVMFSDVRLRELCGVPPDRAAGLQTLEFWLEHLHPDDRSGVLDLRQEMHAGRLERLSIEYRYLHPVRGEVWISHLAGADTRHTTGHAIRTFGVLRDITEGKKAEAALQDLSRRLIRAHEEERALLARELHDDLSQRLAVLAIDVGRVELASPPGAQAGTMRAVREGLVRLSEDVHSLAYQLHPAVLEELGLAEALRTECDRRARRSGIEISLSVDSIPGGVGKEASLCLFRVAQEALNNVNRHASARLAIVTLRQVDGGLLLAVRDDGVGFDPAGPRAGTSLGLASMRERVHLVNGTLDIESAPGQGTAVVVWVPAESASR